MKPYICEGTITINNGKVISVDQANSIAVIDYGNKTCTEELQNVQVISYKEVQ